MSTPLRIPEEKLRYWNYWIGEIARDWHGEVPQRIHESTHQAYGLGSAPPFANEFVRYIGHLECGQPDCRACERWRLRLDRPAHPESRVKAKHALRRLRAVAPKEFDALYTVAILGDTIEGTAARLTQDAISKGRPERYSPTGVFVLVLSGIDKVIDYWRE